MTKHTLRKSVLGTARWSRRVPHRSHIKVCKDRGTKGAQGQGVSQGATSLGLGLFFFWFSPSFCCKTSTAWGVNTLREQEQRGGGAAHSQPPPNLPESRAFLRGSRRDAASPRKQQQPPKEELLRTSLPQLPPASDLHPRLSRSRGGGGGYPAQVTGRSVKICAGSKMLPARSEGLGRVSRLSACRRRPRRCRHPPCLLGSPKESLVSVRRAKQLLHQLFRSVLQARPSTLPKNSR